MRDTPDEQYVDAVGALVDLDQLFLYWALESVTGHWDGYVGASNVAYGGVDRGITMGNRYPNNYYVYHDPAANKFVLLPHGADYSLGNGVGDVRMPSVTDPKLGATTVARLRNLPGTEARLRAAVRDVIDRVWDTDALLARADALGALVRANGLPATREVWTLDDFESAFAARRSFVEGRADAVRAELDAAAG